jgi:hypothetical protein
MRGLHVACARLYCAQAFGRSLGGGEPRGGSGGLAGHLADHASLCTATASRNSATGMPSELSGSPC